MLRTVRCHRHTIPLRLKNFQTILARCKVDQISLGNQYFLCAYICKIKSSCHSSTERVTDTSPLQIRSLYRMIEFMQGQGGYLLTHEWSFFVFESAVILPCFLLFNVFHPAYYIKNTGFRQKRDGNVLASTESEVDISLSARPKVHA